MLLWVGGEPVGEWAECTADQSASWVPRLRREVAWTIASLVICQLHHRRRRRRWRHLPVSNHTATALLQSQHLRLVYSTTPNNTHTHSRLTAFCPGLPWWAGTRKVKPIWILLKQETVSGSGISWTICKSASRSRQITMPAPHHSVFFRPDALPATQPTASKHFYLTTPNNN